MYLKTIEVKNYRLLVDAKLNLNENETVIVGRNNSAKTTLMDFLKKVYNDDKIEFDDYPIDERSELYSAVDRLLSGEITYDAFRLLIKQPSITFTVDYSNEGAVDPLGNLSPFIIDLDDDITDVRIRAEYEFSLPEEQFRSFFNPEIVDDRVHIKRIISSCFSRFFTLSVVAIHPSKDTEQIREKRQLKELFPLYVIQAERSLDESEMANSSPLREIMNKLFSREIDDMEGELRDKTKRLQSDVDAANLQLENDANEIVDKLIDQSMEKFGYPNSEQLHIRAVSRVDVQQSILSGTDLAYVCSANLEEKLPSTHNGLGYKNLIKMELFLAEFSNRLKECTAPSVPLIFIEEPESHMHPQLQETFVAFLKAFVETLVNKSVQVLLTTHSSHVANSVQFEEIRYAKKAGNKVEFLDLNEFVDQDKSNADFLRKYLTLSKCDLFFADKVILVEGASERLLLPDMIRKIDAECRTKNGFQPLASQYYSIIEVGGAYAYRFLPLVKFLSIPTLVLTDIDTVDSDRVSCCVSKGSTSSNQTIKKWVRNKCELGGEDVSIDAIKELPRDCKTDNDGPCHIEYQTEEDGLCGRSLEESIYNVNRNLCGSPSEPIVEANIQFKGEKGKTDFAIDLLLKHSDYKVPGYIRDGLIWLAGVTC